MKLSIKNQSIFILIILIIFFLGCTDETIQGKSIEPIAKTEEQTKLTDSTLEARINPPKGYKRVEIEKDSFAQYLRQVPLKPVNTKVKYYDGRIKENNNVYEAVVDFDIGDKDLLQCADAVIKLRSEYLYKQKQYEKIHFNFTNGFRVDYSEWMKGKRIIVVGNKSDWIDSSYPSNTYEDFLNYLEIIYNYAGTLSLSQELKSIQIDDMEIGDVFIQGSCGNCCRHVV
jgi:hypothetical protein